jgi:hypothetical protein
MVRHAFMLLRVNGSDTRTKVRDKSDDVSHLDVVLSPCCLRAILSVTTSPGSLLKLGRLPQGYIARITPTCIHAVARLITKMLCVSSFALDNARSVAVDTNEQSMHVSI